ncbi:methylated-DNA--[protein]-cysteine S-methyltransferase [Jannaschia pohangensis]|uniref:Methylated-DNA--protein-cysteine methyltransferase n=1 Tax=Jannaschia pohangensis TaxID=390807 RepID=A0A1I3QGY9_9RHOB|nr:methylated-DNA--[protein]-cysteine S-methyltransferase [Jannaschia pohangensis]SFJ33394.1 methylated-DNA-[protein]-cysteine S-methyltransferase [Jannaschia pohangensis]
MIWVGHDTPLGRILLVGDGTAIARLDWPGTAPDPTWTEDPNAFAEARRQIDAYWNDGHSAFDLPLRPKGTPFQRRVWHALQAIPPGQTVSYAHIAAAICQPRGTQAVGQANGANPIPILIPCHRVVAADGSLGGFSGDLSDKRRLLAHERAPHQTDTPRLI